MAKKTKDSNLSLEEKLEQALIPNWDEPYKLPDNWCWLKLLSAFDNYTDSKKKIQQKNYLSSGLYAVIDQGQKLVGGYTDDESMLYDKNLPVVIFGDHTRCVKYVDFSFAQGADGVKVLRPKPFYFPKLFYYAMQSVDIPNLGYRRHFPLFDKFAIPLPPLDEQQRIVARIESLFAKLDEAKEKAQEVVDGFETRKAAILHKAFSGELTQKWREENGVSLNSWETTVLQDICEKIVCGKTPTEHITKQGEVPFLKVYNIVNNQIDFDTTPQFIPTDIHNSKLKSSVLKPNDVIMNIVGPPLRKVAIIPDTYPEWNMNQAIVRFRPLPTLYYRFLYYALICPETLDDVIAATKGVVGQANISISQSRALTIKVPTWNEQIEVVRILDSLIEKEQQVKETAESVIEQIDTMKKAILARAFRGELGTNDPREESALELLKRVLESK